MSFEHAHADRHLGCLRADAARPQAIARERLEPIHQVLDQRAAVVAAGLLPFPSPVSRNGVDGLVAPLRARRSLRPRRSPQVYKGRARLLNVNVPPRGWAVVVRVVYNRMAWSRGSIQGRPASS